MLVAENDTISHTRTRSLLDQISELEVALIAYRARANGGSLDVGDFVDESFELLRSNGSSKSRSEKSITDSEDTSSVDAEILEVFGEEADTLLESIQQNLTILSSIPTDRAALWEIKKSSHTFKGAAGIVGLKKLSELAHRIEDLLGRVSEKNIDPSASQIALLNDAADCLKLLSSGDKPQNIEARLTNLHQQFDTALSTVTTEGSGSPRNDAPELVSEINANAVATSASNRNKSIVRISLVEKQPSTSWNIANSSEYGFYSNVNPTVDHPRWTQSRERRIGEFARRPTLMFNGYADQVASMYTGLDLKKNY